MDNLSRSGSELNVPRLKKNGIEFFKGDIRRQKDVLRFKGITTVIDCCAEPSVLAAFDEPFYTIDTNLIGTIHCLELARRERSNMIFLSTSRVYPIEALNGLAFDEKETRFDFKADAQGEGYSFNGINERFTLNGARSLYGTTKLASEHLLQEYLDMYGLKGVINRFGVVAGPWQMGRIDQGLVGYWIARHLYGGSLKYFGYNGSGKQIRDVLHVEDLCELVSFQWQNLEKVNGRIYNAGGGRENTFSLLELTDRVARMTGKNMGVAPVMEERRADVRMYITDNDRVRKETGWSPQHGLDAVLEDTYKWMKDNQRVLKKVLDT
jgi:CDP-paratose 2-epimerase